MYIKYLNDIFIVWQHGLDELHKFVDHLNSTTDSLKFTVEYSRETIPFMDTKVKLRDRTLYTDLYCKPTDSHSYLLYSSFSPHTSL